MSANAAEWTMALATLATAGVLAVSTFLIRDSLDSFFAGNLQNREIQVCEKTVIAIKQSTDVIREYLTILPRTKLDEFSDPDVAGAISQYRMTVGDGFANQDQVLRDTRARLSLLRFYASPETSLQVDAMDGGIGRVQQLIGVAVAYWNTPHGASEDAQMVAWMTAVKPNPGSEPRDWLAAIYTASDSVFTVVGDINNRCAEIVLGQRRGLI